MHTRRKLMKILLAAAAGVTLLFGKAGLGLQWAYAKAKKVILPKGTEMSELVAKNPAKLDTRNLETSPMTEFDVMGQTNHPVNIGDWRLHVSGAVTQPGQFTYDDLLKMPAVERNVLLICPGFFAYNGLWKGITMETFLKAVGFKPEATHVKFSGPKGISRKSKRFAIDEVMADKVFLAYQVNGEPLPERHGYPLRLVAEDHYGGRWVKYVDKVIVVAK